MIRLYLQRYGHGPGMDVARARWATDLDYVAAVAELRFGGKG